MTRNMRLGALALLLAVPLTLSLRIFVGTEYAGWPAGGCAAGFLLLCSRKQVLPGLVGLSVLSLVVIQRSYELTWVTALISTVSLTLPALLTRRILRGRDWRTLSFKDESDLQRYHLAVVASAALTALLSLALALLSMPTQRSLTISAIAFLGTLTGQQLVLPFLYEHRRRAPLGSHLELTIQRCVVALTFVLLFTLDSPVAVISIVMPILGWGAMRSTRLEAQLQLAVISVAAYVLTLAGHGPFSHAGSGVPTALLPMLMYLFLTSCAYLTFPLSSLVEQLATTTEHADRGAQTIARLLDSAAGTVFLATDRAGVVTHCNPAAEAALGRSAEEIIGKSASLLYTGEEVALHAAHFGVPARHKEVVLAMARTGERRDWHLPGDEHGRILSVSVSPVLDEPGTRVVGHIIAGEDVTDRHRMHDATVEALRREHAALARLEEIDKVKQDLVSNVSHELRTPITSIAGYIELLGDGALGEVSPLQADVIERIERNTTRLTMLVGDLLTLSRAESGELELQRTEVDLRTVVRDAAELIRETMGQRRIDLRVEFGERPVMTYADAHEMERVALNLISNALKFTPDGGIIVVRVSTTAAGAELTISDTGVGIPLSDQEHLFTRFFRSRSATESAIPGTGLGLSIVQSLVHQHGGEVHLWSEPGKGTRVRVTLPHAYEPGEPVEPSEAGESGEAAEPVEMVAEASSA